MRGPAVAAAAFAIGIVLAAAFLAPAPGPSADAAPEDLAPAALAAGSGAPSIPRPSWAVGDAWRAGFGSLEPICWVVVVAASDLGYHQGFWCPKENEGLAESLAIQAAVFDAPQVGLFGPALDGRATRSEGATAWYEWPLHDGRAWSTEDRGTPIDVVARWTGDRYVMTATSQGEPYATWDYVPVLRWWSALRYASGYEVVVEERTTAWDLGAVSATATPRLRDAQEGGAVYGVPRTFVAEESDEMLALLQVRDGGPYAERFELRDPQMRSAHQATAQNVVGRTGIGLSLVGSVPGTWTVVRAGATGGDASLDVFSIAFERLLPGAAA